MGVFDQAARYATQAEPEPATLVRWKELAAQVTDRRARGDLVQIAVVFAELAGCLPAWENGLEGWDMTESIVVNRWIEQGRREQSLVTRREDVSRIVRLRFPGSIPVEIMDLINRQDSQEILQHWLDAAATALSAEQFLDALRR